MELLLFYAFLAIFFSFLCSILEAVLLSVTPTFINVSKEEGLWFAEPLEQLKKDIDKPLISILTLNTVAHTVGSILVGEQAGKIYANAEPVSLFGTQISVSQVTIVSALMTIAVLIISEIIPKTIGATFWKQLAGFTTTTLNAMVTIMKFTGILWIMERITKLFGSKENESVFSRDDFSAMASAAERSGELEGGESTIIRNLMHLQDLTVNDIMTPRVVMVTANQDSHIDNFYRSNKDLRFSRIPVYEVENDHITGYVLKDDVLKSIIEGMGESSLKDIRRDITVVKSTTNLDDVFEDLIVKNEHIAVVVDDYGSLVGLVTQEDVVETLIGTEITDEFDDIEDLQQHARNKWEQRAKRRGLLDQ